MYTRFRFPDGGFAKKWGKFSIVAFWWKIFCFKDWTRPNKHNQRILKLKIESQLYSRQWHMEFGRPKRWRPYFFSTLQGEWNIVLATKSMHKMLHVICLCLPVILTNDSLRCSRSWSEKTYPMCSLLNFSFPPTKKEEYPPMTLLAQLWRTSPHHLKMCKCLSKHRKMLLCM